MVQCAEATSPTCRVRTALGSAGRRRRSMSRLSTFIPGAGASGPTPVWSTPRKPALYRSLGNFGASARRNHRSVGATDGNDTEAVQGATSASSCEMDRYLPLGVEAWSEHRRTEYPSTACTTDKSGVPSCGTGRHLPYVEEYQQNNASLQAAIQTLGAEQQNGDRSGDVMWAPCIGMQTV
ncbi:MAG: SusD/RagB family nutrient-binding outer membrane lipoprotein [Alistipes shahii]